MTDVLAAAKLVVIKVGSSLLVDAETGTLRREWLKSLAGDIAALKHEGKEVVLVSSGAIALGRRALKLKPGALRLEESQAAAAAGQVRLAGAWAEVLRAEEITAAQVLLILDDMEHRRRYLNARATLKTLLALGAVPVINENDTVATSEIQFGDNDQLAARVASMMEADCLVLLSDVDGLYTANPGLDATAEHIPSVPVITAEIEAMAGGSVSGFGRGGMTSKIIAAKIAVVAGSDVVIAKGKTLNPIAAIRSGGRNTRFFASETPAAARKRWIGGVLHPQGVLIIDDGAVRALKSGSSLLPAGIRQIDGRFERGDAVIIRDQTGLEIARGLTAYGAGDAERIAGKKSLEIEAILGYPGRDEMIHRDDLTLTVDA
ncbi:MAG: glutamate 5-kinase [Rhizomicrobium sp.]|nr:glutamate 5-kinase [Rhizomicrobium sp.]